MEYIILIVDDNASNLESAQKFLGKEYRVAAAKSGAAALKYLERNTPDLILLDIIMPEMDGFSVIEKLKADPRLAQIPVIFLTADNDPETETKCFAYGAVDFVRKPFLPNVLRSRVNKTIELEKYRGSLETMVQEQAEIISQRSLRISKIQEHVIMSMAALIESRDHSTGNHVTNTKNYVHMIAMKLKELGLFRDILTEEYIQNLIKAAPLHDVGKIKTPDAILKKPGRLTPEEFIVMKDHTIYGKEIINNIIGGIEDPEYALLACDIAMYHHERWDGTGYPAGLKGEEIPLCARIMALADVFDALYEERCYKKPVRPASKVMMILKENAGTQFDPVITDVFAGMEEEISRFLGEVP